MEGLHSYTKFLKRGFGRTTDHASQDVRAGLLTREQGFKLAKEYDTEKPEVLNFLLDQTGLSEEEFNEIMLKHRKNYLLNTGLTEEDFQKILKKHQRSRKINKSDELYSKNIK